jgi:BirA family transcriptional regulator, biotin operon repressor / biotin---[acetyl-CoA-carboxylase] ligase
VNYDGLGDAELARLLGVPLVRLYDSVPSTLDLAHELGESGAPHGSTVLAEIQTAGRGRHGRPWASPKGGLWLAMLARPNEPPQGGALAVRVGLLAREAVAEVVPEAAPRLKWPNDLIVAGRKAGGVLCEATWSGSRLAWVAIGVGINVKGPAAPAVADTAIALDDVAEGVTRVAVLAALVPRLLGTAAAPALLTDGERAAFRAVCWQDGGAPIEDIEPDGALIVRSRAGRERRTAPA